MVTVVAVALFIFFSVTTEHFLAADNFLNILRNLSFVGIVAVGMTYVFIAEELDLSVGSVFGFLTVPFSSRGMALTRGSECSRSASPDLRSAQ